MILQIVHFDSKNYTIPLAWVLRPVVFSSGGLPFLLGTGWPTTQRLCADVKMFQRANHHSSTPPMWALRAEWTDISPQLKTPRNPSIMNSQSVRNKILCSDGAMIELYGLHSQHPSREAWQLHRIAVDLRLGGRFTFKLTMTLSTQSRLSWRQLCDCSWGNQWPE